MDINFTRLDLLLASPAEVPTTPASPSDDAIAQLSQVLHRALLDSPQQLRFQMRIEDASPLRLMWIGAGHTAGVGYWMADDRVEAISLLLAGVDLVEDLSALQIVMCAAPAALPEGAIDAILQTPRPIIACLYSRPILLSDLSISTGVSALAIAFFGMLGIGAESESHSM